VCIAAEKGETTPTTKKKYSIVKPSRNAIKMSENRNKQIT